MKKEFFSWLHLVAPLCILVGLLASRNSFEAIILILAMFFVFGVLTVAVGIAAICDTWKNGEGIHRYKEVKTESPNLSAERDEKGTI